jgi:DNA invertase Pin-like site-specific DNA recombinase
VQVNGKVGGMGERSARWLRVSTGKQEEGMQIPDVERWETSHGYDVRKTYEIPGASAFKPGTKKFDETWTQVIKDIMNGVFTVLVVWKLDRIDRKELAYDMMRQVLDAGGRVEFVTEQHLNEFNSLGGKIGLIAAQHQAHKESKDKQDRAFMTRQYIRSNGGIVSRPPFGYTVEGPKYGKYFVINESLRTIVETIFAKCIEGDSLVTIAKWLDSEGVPTARGGKWSNTALKNIINNRAYMGYVTDDDGKTIGTCPVIIDAAIHKAANDALHSRPKRGPILAENRALLAGVLHCPQCATGAPMYRLSPMYRLASKVGPVLADGSRAKAYFYRCAGRGAQRKGCGNMVLLDTVDAAVNTIMTTTDLPIMRRVFVPGHNHGAEIADVDYRITQLSPEGLTRQEYRAKQDALWDEKEAYEHMEDVPDSWDYVDTGETYASKWASSDMAGRQDMLKDCDVYATKDYVVVEITDEQGHEIPRRIKLQ